MTDQQLSDTATLDPGQPDVATDAAAGAVADAVEVIDQALAQMMQRELVASGEVADLLLDLRMLLVADR